MKVMLEQMAQPYLLRIIEEDKEQIATKLQSLWDSKKEEITFAGFRKGKVPQNIAESKLGFENLYKEYLDELVINAVNETNTTQNVTVVDIQQIVPEKLDKDSIIMQVVTYLKPQVESLNFSNINLKSYSDVPETEEVDAQFELLQQQNAIVRPVVDRGVQFGDMITISYVGSLNGVPFQGGTASQQQLLLTEASFIPGFGESILGMTPNQNKTFEVVFPENYQATHLAGQRASFDLTLHEIKTKEVPKLSDDFAVSCGFISLAEMRVEITKALKERKQSLNRAKYETEICLELLKRAEIQPIPQTMIQKRLAFLLQSEAASMSLSPEDYLARHKMDKDTFDRTYYYAALRDIKVQLILDFVASRVGISVSQNEVDSYLEFEAAKVNLSLEEAKKRVSPDQLEAQVRLRKAYDYLLDQATYQ